MSPDVIAIGASAGGVEALRALVAGLPPDLPAAVLVVLHVPRTSPSALPAILSRTGPLPARAARDGEPIQHGHIYVAPADHHLLVLEQRLRLSRGPSENGHRPAIDPLFRSAARALGPRVIGVVLSGARDDGAAGLATIAQHGGQCVIQEPADALHESMPRAAMERVTADAVAPVAAMGDLLAEMVSEQDARAAGIAEGDRVRIESARGAVEAPARVNGIRAGVVFVPFHYGYWDAGDNGGHERAANEMTVTSWDPVSKQPLFKVAAVRIQRVERS